MKIFEIKAYEPKICSTTMPVAIGTTRARTGMGTNRLIAAAIAPMSVPALIVLAMISKETAE